MISTKYGHFDNEKWAVLCQLCLAEKYRDDEICFIENEPVNYGINCFTQTGLAFIYYSPDEYLGKNALLTHQLNFLNRNLEKLASYQSQLLKKHPRFKVNRLYFITPKINYTEAEEFCKELQESMIQQKILSFDENHAEIIIKDIEFLKPELHRFTPKPVIITEGHEGTSNLLTLEILDELNEEIRNSGRDNNIMELKVEFIIQKYLDGFQLLEKWRINYPYDYEKFLMLTGTIEGTINYDNYTELFNQENISTAKNYIINEFPFLETGKVECLSNYILADRIIRQLNIYNQL